MTLRTVLCAHLSIRDPIESTNDKNQTEGAVCNTLTIDDELQQAIPSTTTHQGAFDIDLPNDVDPDLKQVTDDHKLLITQQLGKTTIAEPFIDAGNAILVKVPPRPIPF